MTIQREKTKRAIEVAFLSLLCDTPIEKITVREIANKAQISRNTFYTHFTSVYDLKDRVMDGIKSSIAMRMEHDSDVTQLGLKTSLTAMITYLYENQELLRLFFQTQEGNFQLLSVIQSGITLWRLRAHISQSDTAANVQIIMSVHGMAGILYHWLYGQIRLDQDQLLTALLSAVRFHPDQP
ncbi:TetR/AcrR family transcriptional regulator [Secundilactobacillus collinoides]|uniref:HTH tetR-type domain-containing protein n=1 Tax=Secundilactobacillus collinoides DSM 20515 = JCM 1123 TaxID=1423733 RepID=A0A0R2B5I5_SECCO|nr:TetR/AcrR family transcriptional regulator [Secundilactobacillus collinoides]KRM74423.1 hypothetical protein FC82_GL000183 [Secundilactobacillus collinoides DSM 20515 = JCM 1123]